MNTTQRAYITGFVKRANEYGYSDNQAIELLKKSGSSWLVDAHKAGKQPELGKQSAEQAPYTGVKTLGEMWNEFKTKTPTLATKLPVAKGLPSIDPRLAVK